VREVMQGRPAGALLEPRFNAGVSLLKEHGLAYDLLIFEDQLGEARTFADRHSGLTIVLDHVAKPRIREGRRPQWERDLRELAKRPHVHCKISGMATEADDCHPDILRPFFEIAVDAFTPSRLMFGSDWPVCLSKIGYGPWLEMLKNWTQGWTKAERDDFFGATACRAYQLQPIE
jgi:L-fuconolactonase